MIGYLSYKYKDMIRWHHMVHEIEDGIKLDEDDSTLIEQLIEF